MKKKLSNDKIAHLLFDTPGVIVYNTKKRIEVQPGVMTPLVVNIKATFADFEVRSEIAKELAKAVSPKSNCICGIESGGSYYASAVADKLRKPLILFRKARKGYGLGDRLVGNPPRVKNGLIAIVDDVIGEGKISTANVLALTRLGYRTEICVIYSYLPEMKDFMHKLRIVPLSDINSLCRVGLRKKRFTVKDVDLIKKECRYSSR